MQAVEMVALDQNNDIYFIQNQPHIITECFKQ